ncbi:Polyneuridine-aldehyde esterase [Linum perenne]
MEKAAAGNKKQHFVLVHGAAHGAWCWYKLIPLLKSNGHRVTALDLGACGTNPKQLDEIHTISDYAEPLMQFMAALSGDERVVLVAHSFGGYIISLAMEKFEKKVVVAVYVTALMPDLVHPPAGLMIEDLELAKLMLRPFKFFLKDLSSESLLSEAKFGSVKRVYIVCKEDVVMSQEFQERVIQSYPPDEVKYIEDADHMAMLSKPEQLCKCLLEVAGEDWLQG